MDQSAREAVVLEGYLQRRPTNKALVKRWQTRHVTLTRSSLTIRKKKDGNPSSLPPPASTSFTILTYKDMKMATSRSSQKQK